MAAKKTKRKGSLHAPTSSKLQRIEVTSVERLASIQQIKDFLRDQMLIFLEGPSGSGKTSLVKNLANELELPLQIVQLNDQNDSRTLMGSYHCTEVPGEFLWMPSNFAKCLCSRSLILLEDLDCANPDLVAMLLQLAEDRYFSTISTKEPIHSECRIIATLQEKRRNPGSSSIIDTYHVTVNLPSFTNAEIEGIINEAYPNLRRIQSKLLEVFFMIQNEVSNLPLTERRLISTDLFRACARLNQFPNFDDHISIFNELNDLWLMSITNQESRKLIGLKLANSLVISPDQYNFLLFMRKPEVTIAEMNVKIGRATLSKLQRIDSENALSFGLTREHCQLLERISACALRNESVLLTGETGVGKTSVIQLLASYMNASLRVVNMSQDSDTSDLIGGYKPVSIITIIRPLFEDYETLFDQTFDRAKNVKFFTHLQNCLSTGRFADFLRLLIETALKAIEQPKTDHFSWTKLIVRAKRILHSLSSRKSALPFAYIRGIVSEAAELGHWLLIDEINLASPDCLESVVRVLEGTLSCHKNFRLFACMNPPTDAGKRQLPSNIRSRFTEFFVFETTELEQLAIIVRNYAPTIPAQRLNSLLNFYNETRLLMPRRYSLRNLCRALLFATDNPYGNELRSLYEGINIAFTSELDQESSLKFSKVLDKHFKEIPSGLARPPTEKGYMYDWILGATSAFIPDNPYGLNVVSKIEKFSQKAPQLGDVQGSYIEKGPKPIEQDPSYVYTKSVTYNLAHIARVVANGRFPILLEGETSAGKTSMILHLAKITGNQVFRINNHEYTDIQEYIGSYAPDASGRLSFVEGVLLKAVRDGDWVILDELNLAPVEVLEALNRLLDDNRELYIGELNTTFRAHPRFRLFATQNPVGTYAGRKRLSRAFLNRFVIFQFQHPPFLELEEIVMARCAVPPSAAKLMIEVLIQLKNSRSITGIFSASDGLMTLRDLFRWGNRLSASSCEDWRQSLADQGYFLLACRCRNSQDHDRILEVIEKNLKRKIDVEHLFAAHSPYFPKELQCLEENTDLVLTYPMRRMLVLCSEAWKCNEPVLMIGETGCGKTTAVQIISKDNLLSINCHERTDTSDLLGSIRPKADGTFFYQDGVVVRAMKTGTKLLVDEISLASDSVLERLNPLLEPARTVLLTDVGAEAENVRAHEEFQLAATMNPGNDYGKKELSKALRNRFTEVWCSTNFTFGDLVKIVHKKMLPLMKPEPTLCDKISRLIVEYLSFYLECVGHIIRTTISIRDMIFASELFIALFIRKKWHLIDAAIASTYGYVIPLLLSSSVRVSFDVEQVKSELALKCVEIFSKYGLTVDIEIIKAKSIMGENEIISRENCLSIGSLLEIPFGPRKPRCPPSFSFNAPTCRINTFYIARALAIDKPILLEGSPGAGKSSLIVSLAMATGQSLIRLNLSEQTDLSDLFGSDVPIILDDGTISFAWRDGPILKAIKQGTWVLLDEMNLASQSILEGLNACFDFRHELFIPELNRTFKIEKKDVRFFACQNPQNQGGNRRALPKSFLNRFSILEKDLIVKMITLTEKIVGNEEMQRAGGPFEFNLRDLIRWSELVLKHRDPSFGFELLYLNRFRSEEIRMNARSLFEDLFGIKSSVPIPNLNIQDNRPDGKIYLEVGPVRLQTNSKNPLKTNNVKRILSSQALLLQNLAACVKMDWLTLLVGPANIGKRSSIECLANLCGTEVKNFRLTSETDTLDLIGSYEQILDTTSLSDIKDKFMRLVEENPDVILNSFNFALAKCEHILDMKILLQQASLLIKNDDLKVSIESLYESISSGSMRFEWKNSEFVEAYTKGHWIIFEDVNCCSAAVLDRLNTTLETHGELIVSEHAGDQSASKPLPRHKNFRVFFTMDPRNGSLSRAMRNRSVEIFVDFHETWSNVTNDAFNVIFGENLPTLETSYGILEKFDPKSLLKIAALQESQRAKLDKYNKHKERELGDEMFTEQEEVMKFKVLVQTPFVQAFNIFKQSLLAWKRHIWNVVSLETLEPVAALLMACSSLLPHELNLEKLFFNIDENVKMRFCSTLKSFHEIHQSNANFFFTSDNMKNFGDLSSHLNTFVHSLFLNWVLAKLGSCSYVEGSVLHLGNLFERRKISVTELPTTVVIQLYRFFTSLKDALSNFVIFQDGSIVEALEFLFYLTIFYLLACEQLTERLGTVSLQVAFSRLLSNIYFPLNTKSILSEALNLLHASFRTADLTESKNFEEVIATYAFCRPLSEKSEADSIRALVRNLQHEESLSESENKIFEKALRSVKDLLMAVSFITNDQFLPIESYDFSSKSFTLHMVNRFPFTDSEIKKSIATLFFLTSNCAVKYFKSSIRNVDLFQSQFTMEVIINLWKSFNFTNKFYQISLRDAHEARTQLQDYQIAIWILIKNETNVLSNFESRLSAIDMIDNKEIISGNLSAFIDRISDYLKRLTPPPNFIDPIIKQEIQQAYAIRALQVIEELIEPIQRFLLLTTAHWNCYQMENSVHPLVNTIFRLRAAFLQELESSKRSVESYYRPVYSHFGNLCTELKGFTEMALRWIQESMDGFQFLNSKLKDRPMKKIKFYVAQIETFVSSADSFVKRMLSDFCEFPDILFPYVIVVQSLMVMLSSCQQEMHRHMDYERTQKFLQISRKINFNAEFQKVLFDETFLDMALREDSPMPIHLQEHVVQSIASSNEDSKNILNWLSSKWRFWYEQNTEKREKMFVYKQTGGGTSDEEMVDEDDLETQYLIPDYSSSSFEDIQPFSNEVLKAEQLYKALCLLNDNAISEIGPPDVLSPIIWTLDNFVGTTSTFSKEFLLELKDLHFIEINKLVNNCTPTKQLAKESFNVYFANDPALTLSCLEALQKVEGGVRRLLLEFPENEVLLNILESILKFMALSFEASQMQLAALLEKILEETEHWEKLADRSRSLSEEVNELRYILVEWRKLEVLYWSRILERVQSDSEQLSFLISWPLFESLKSIGTAHQTQNLLAALIEWLNSSTYMDFSARLHSGHLLARWVELMKGDFLLAQQIRSILHYFSQYIDVVGEQFKKDKDEIEKELNGFIKVVKYQDLNLWSVKQSVKKAHGHIAKLIKKLKKNGNQTAASLFDIWMPKLPELPSSLSITLSPLVGGSLAMKITDVNKLIHSLVGNMPNYNCFENMSLRCAELLEILESDVKYDGDDEAKQKQQGRALGDRRKRFFHLIKASAEFGLTSRRGQRVKSEELLMNSLMAKSLSLLPNSSEVNNLLLQSSLSRNLVIRFVNKLNSQQSPHVTRQVPVSVMDHIKGISDFGLYWLLNAASAIENYLDRCRYLPLYRDAIDVLIENYQNKAADLDHKLLSDNRFNCLKIVKKIRSVIGRITEVIKSAPESFAENSIPQYPALNCGILHKQRHDYGQFVNVAERCLNFIMNLEKEIDYELKPLEIPGSISFWKSENAVRFANVLKSCLDELQPMVTSPFTNEFPEHSHMLLDLIESLRTFAFIPKRNSLQVLELSSEISNEILLKIQAIYNAFKSAISPNDSKSIDHMKRLIEIMSSIDLIMITNGVNDFLKELSREQFSTIENLTKSRDVISGICQTFDLISRHFSAYVEWFSCYFIHFEHLAFHIVQKGFVNPIPKDEKSATEEGKGGDMTTDVSGMGEGQGTNDVSDQIDEAGQLEGLQDETKNKQPDDRQSAFDDVETPIDAEDDFAANLENIDENVSDKEDGEDETENPEENIDWNMGNVEESEENQLDPKLWDDKPQEETGDLDQKDEGAKNQNDELAAREEDSNLASNSHEDTIEEQNEEEDKGDAEQPDDEAMEYANEINLENEDESNSDIEMEPVEAENETPIDQTNDDSQVEQIEADENLSDLENETEMNEENLKETAENKAEQDNQFPSELAQTNRGGMEEVKDQEANEQSNQMNKEKPVVEEKNGANDRDEVSAEYRGNDGSSNSKIPSKENTSAQDEVDEEMRQHEETSKRIIEEELPTVEDEKELNEMIPGEETEKENTGNLAHTIDEEINPHDRKIIEKATVEEAILSRNQYEKIIENQPIQRKAPENASKENTIRPIDRVESERVKSERDRETIINVSLSLYELAKTEAVDTMQLEEILQDMNISKDDYRALQTKWAKITDSVSILASELAENLRIIIEPSIATKLQGDYRTGKRLNMRRLIAYIASDYRKDRIWMRRTKKSQRNYQICIAVDDSASMNENFMSEITCQSVCLIEKALRQLEVGELFICKFGKTVTFLNELNSQTNENLGPRLLQELKFDQQKTDLINLLNVAGSRFTSARQDSRPPNQMLIIIGDGRGVLSDSLERTKEAIRRLQDERVTVLFIIVDSGEKSIVDTTIAEFNDGQVQLIPYMSKFPFPFYALVRHINVLPATMAESLRQWFELTIGD